MLPSRSRAFLANEVRKPDVIQVHGIWTGHSSATLALAVKYQKPVIISAHGMLDGWALRHKAWKKMVYSRLVEHRTISRGVCLRALTKIEAENYRDYGLSLPVVVIPNGVDAPELATPSEFLEAYPQLRGKRLILFLGRIHKKKGVDLLVDAWKAISPELEGAHLVIAGPDDGALGRIESTSITLCGLLTGSLKWSAIAAATVFVLPSFSEGLSMATLEALWQGVPVMITRECNFREAESLDSTFVIEPTVPSIVAVLRRVLSHTAGELRERGKTGSNFVRGQYAWPVVAQQMADVYDWMRGGPLPSSMIFDS